MMTRAKPALGWVVIRTVVALIVVCAMVVRSDYVDDAAMHNCKWVNRVQPDQLLEQFRFLVSEKFVGQDQAVDITLSALRRFQPNDLLLLHFVGASGTGKTHLASLVQRSFFALNRCQQGENLF